MLYQRIKNLAKATCLSQRTLGECLGVHGRTFENYLNEKRQDNLWPLLPKILEEYPRVSRQWLYFGEGPMFIGMGIPLEDPVPLRSVVQAVEAIANDAKTSDSGIWKYVYSVLHGALSDQAVKDQPLPAIDEDLLELVVEKLETALQKAGAKLPPKAKAEAVRQLYMMVLEKEAAGQDAEEARKTLDVLGDIIGNIAVGD